MRTIQLFTAAAVFWAGAATSLTGAAVTGPLNPFGFPEKNLAFLKVTRYTLQEGDTVTSVAKTSGLTVETVLSFNQVASPRFLRAGQPLRLPNQDGILVTLDGPTSVAALAQTYRVFPSLILLANRLPEDTREVEGGIFVPRAQYDAEELRKTLGGYFSWPTKGGRITSYFGKRNDPFTGVKSSHSGVDIANYHGAPVLAAGSGTVTATGFSSILGNYIQINQGQGYVVVYGHLSAILTKAGKKVRGGQLIGRVGSTGYSTGPHLHFTAYRYNRLLNPMRLFG